MMRARLALVVLSCLGVATAEAQGLRGRLTELFTFGTCGRPLCLDGSVSAANGHGDHFLPNLIAGNSAVISFITEAIASNAANIPLSASSSGATFRFVGGLPVRTSTSSGPIFGERAATLGRGRVFLGASMTGIRFRSLRGTPLDHLVLNFTHQDVGTPGLGDPLLENDVLQMRLDLGVSLLVTTFFATYGLSDGLDVSLAVPIVHTSITGRSEAQVTPFGSTAVHFFTGTPAEPGLIANAATFGSATGLGDLAVRVKGNVRAGERVSVALMGDARLPTGNEDDLLGAGTLALRGSGIVSGRFGEFAPHLNLGYLWWPGGDRTDALLVTAGFDQPLNAWTTLAVDVVSEWELGKERLPLPGTVTIQFPFTRTVEPTNLPNRRDHRVNGSVGFKFRTGGGPTIVTNALVPLRRGGLQPTVAWTLGLDFDL